jgi:hypothetical protein
VVTGYAQGYDPVTKKVTTAHRISYMAFKGDIPDGCDIDHLCSNKACVNPDHLEAVPRSVNTQRAYDRGELSQRVTLVCRNGHWKLGDNVYVTPSGFRRCRECGRQAVRRSRSKRKSV